MSDAPPCSNTHLTQALWFYFTLFVAFRGVLAYFFRLSAQTYFICMCKTVFTQKLCAPSCLFLGWPPVQRKKIRSCSVGHSNAKTSVVRVKNISSYVWLGLIPNRQRSLYSANEMSNSYWIKGSLKVYLVINSPPTQEHVMRTKNWRWKAEAKISFNIGAKCWTAAQEQDTVEETDCPMEGQIFARDKIQSTGLSDN